MSCAIQMSQKEKSKMDISKHIILEELYELGLMIEQLPASENQTNMSVKLNDAMIIADTMVDLLRDDPPGDVTK